MAGAAIRRPRGGQLLSASLWGVCWARVFAIATLLFAVPASQEVLERVSAMVIPSCDDDCGSNCDCSDCAPGDCAHCLGCASTPTLPVAPPALVGDVLFSEAPTHPLTEVALTAGYGLAPFRPPTS